LICTDQSVRSLFREREITVAVAVPKCAAITRLHKLLVGVFADGIEHAVALNITVPPDHDERLNPGLAINASPASATHSVKVRRTIPRRVPILRLIVQSPHSS
jgi:hypothetical protein